MCQRKRASPPLYAPQVSRESARPQVASHDTPKDPTERHAGIISPLAFHNSSCKARFDAPSFSSNLFLQFW